MSQTKMMGLNTDAGKLNFPEEATLYEKNLDIVNSVRVRRKGLEGFSNTFIGPS